MFESVFQSFDETGGPEHGAERVRALRAELAQRGLDGFITPRSDEHQNEYVPASEERLLWLTGFAGSAGVAIVLKDKAAIFVDGRYTVQVRQQADDSVFEFQHVVETPSHAWIAKSLGAGEALGYDPRLHTPEGASRLAAACAQAGARLVGVETNPIDAIWRDRPAPPLGAIVPHKARFAGESAASKIDRVRRTLTADGLLVSDPHNMAWLFNVRGADAPHTPLPLGYAFVPREGRPRIFVDARKPTPAGLKALAPHADLAAPETLAAFLAELGGMGRRIAFDSATGAALHVQTLERAGGKAEVGADPITLMKAVKNKVEIAGARAAHLRDGVAMARFLCWFDREAPRGRLTEVDAVKALETFRRETAALKEISFPTIAAAGSNAAIPHYRVSFGSNRRIDRGLFLVDSGGQYDDGTTDVTRTIAVGRPSKFARDRFTRVLEGHIAIARAVFPKGTTGAQIDTLARAPLWAVGADFDHGVGHGVGSYLSVHEGPQRIARTGTTALAAGMILSNEPGYYAPGDFGVRIENLVIVAPRAIAGAEREMLGFETLTLAPIDLRLVEPRQMRADDVAWLDAYHAWVRHTLSPHLDASTRRWLVDATRRIGPRRRARL